MVALSANCSLASPAFLLSKKNRSTAVNLPVFRLRASAQDDPDCNDEECAPEKEVGKISMEWLAGEKTKVAGTFPPRKRGWTGVANKLDSPLLIRAASSSNLSSGLFVDCVMQPVIYVSESAISSGSAGSSADGADNTAGLVAFVALICVAGASSILLQVSKNPVPVQTAAYSGPSLTYYINKFKQPEVTEASLPALSTETAPPVQSESPVAPETLEVQVGSGNTVDSPAQTSISES